MKKLITSACIAGLTASSMSAAIVSVSSAITSDTTWTSSNEYVLTDIIFVRNATLTIQAGTIIRGEPKSGETVNDPGALVITRSAQIDAEGTPSNPIIFTTAALDSDGDGQYSDESYDYASSINYTTEINGGASFLDSDPANSPLTPGFGYSTVAGSTAHISSDEYRGLWGGVIILGNAPTNIMEIADVDPDPGVEEYRLSKTSILDRTDLDDIFEGFIEGLDPLVTNNNDGVYGGSNPNDSSGTFKYVSIRHGGTNIDTNNEINGLTMGGVGAGTLIEFVEVYCNNDDGFEWFGGTVNTRYLVSLYNNDDSFDIDEGFTGLGQFWFSLQLDDANNGDHGGEHDGTAGNFSFVDIDSLNGTTITGTGGAGIGLPMGFPTVYNATYVNSPDGDNMLKFDDSFGGNYYNSIFVGTPSVLVNVTGDAQGRVDAGDCDFVSNSVFYNINGKTGALANADLSDYSGLQSILAANGNVSGTNPFASLTNTAVRSGVDPRASSATPGSVSLEPVTATFFITASYAGAFDPVETDYWTDDWSVFSANVDNK